MDSYETTSCTEVVSTAEQQSRPILLDEGDMDYTTALEIPELQDTELAILKNLISESWKTGAVT